jgi:heme-degrading monooxygenase HmoA
MLARVTTFHAKLDHAEEGARIFQEGIPAIRDLDGFKDAVLLVDRGTGKAMTIALWEDQQALQAAAPAAGKLFQQAAHTIDGTPQRQVYEVLDYRPKQNRRFARVSTGIVHPIAFNDPGTATIIEAASQQPGYAGFLVLGNRENNVLMGMSFWDSKEHLDASEGGYYTREMEKSRDQFEGGQWSREIYEVAAQS